ncbi:unnamed protein product, partial [Cyprideis torosa]
MSSEPPPCPSSAASARKPIRRNPGRHAHKGRQMVHADDALFVADPEALTRKRTGIVYDEVFLQHQCERCPERVIAECKRCEELDILSSSCTRVPVRPARMDELKAVQPRSVAEDTVGGTVDLVSKIAKGQLQNGLSLVRPGSTWFDLAVAAQAALNKALKSSAIDSESEKEPLGLYWGLPVPPCPPLSPLEPVDPTTWETIWEAISRFGEDRLISCFLTSAFVKPLSALPPEGPQPPFPTKDTNPGPPTRAMPIEKVSSCFPLPVPGGPQQPARVAYVFDPSMEGHESMVSHPENPNRVRRIMENLTSTGVAQRCGHVPSRPATDEEVLTVYDASLLDIVKRIKDLKPSEQLSLGESLDSIYVNGQTETAARVALGSMLNLTDWVIQGGKGHSGLAVIRPPGHHAESDEPSGFCFFNNVAIAAQRALDDHLLKRVLVVDWDVHHGSGIQNAFLRDPRVLYISLLLFLGGSFYPEGQGGAIPVVGEGSGEGFNVNIPWEQTKMGDPEYIQAFLGTVLPICYEFNPELVLVSAGFDAAVGDPLGRCSVTPACYGVMTNLLCPLAEGKMVVALEGGYNLASISSAMTLCAKALLGDPPGRLDCNKMKQSATAVLRGASAVQAPFWRLVFRQPPR